MTGPRHAPFASLPPWLSATWARLQQWREAPPAGVLMMSPGSSDATALARQWAPLLLCESASGADTACGTCRSCRELAAGTHPDYRELEPLPDKRDISIDQIRAAADWSSRTARVRRRLLWVLDAERMNRNAANAFLKTLEEPPSGLVIVLTSRQPHRLPVTIRSRCQCLALARPQPRAFAQWLQGQGMDPARSQLAAAVSPGDTLRALTIDEQTEARYERWCRAWHAAVVQGETLDAAKLLDDDDFPDAIVWIQRQLVHLAANAGAAQKIGPAWDVTVRLRAMQGIALNRLLQAEELMMHLRVACRELPAPTPA
ncbi:MAG: hypothetical protein ABF296_03205 [Oceanococcaceae bacterium]